MGRFWKIQRGGGSYEKSLPWVGHGYFLEPHIYTNRREKKEKIVIVTENKVTYNIIYV